MSEKILAIIVTYNPNVKDFEKNLSTYMFQVDKALIIDNSTDASIKLSLEKIVKKYKNVLFKSMEENKGIAYAQNIGYEYAKKHGFKYILEIDQDSFLPKNYVCGLLRAFEYINKHLDKNIIAIGGLDFNLATNKFYRKYSNRNSSCYIKVDKTLSSGFLVKLDLIDKIGLKNEDFFIDFVDWEWCWRAVYKGYSIYVDKNSIIYHKKGEKSINFFNLFEINVSSPIRHYYQFRNTIFLFKYKYVPLKIKISLLIKNVVKIIIYPIILDKKYERLKFMLKGLKDGIRGINGKFTG
ncbi:glycosyltransferase family 2 protein [Persephonella sp.]